MKVQCLREVVTAIVSPHAAQVEVMSVKEGEAEPNLFADMDLNADGFLSKGEVEVFFTKGEEVAPDALWEMEDQDKDGRISWKEFSGPKGEVTAGMGARARARARRRAAQLERGGEL